MPEAIAAPDAGAAAAGAGVTPAATPGASAAQPAGGEISGGIAGAMKEFESQVTPKPKADAAKGAGDAKGKEAGVKAGDAKSGDGKATDGKATPKDPWETAPGNLKGEHFKMRRQFEDKIAGYETRIKDIEAKSKEAPGDAKAIEGFQKQIADLNKRLAATDYRQSQEFQNQYVGRWNSEYKTAVEEVKKFAIKTVDAEGKESTRPATEQDFQRVMNLPPGDQDEAISKLFGSAGQRVFSRIFRLHEIQESANRALEEHASKSEVAAKEKEASDLKNTNEYNTAYTSSVQELQTNYPQHFAADEKDPEASEALKKGYEFVDKVLEKSDAFTNGDRAAYNAVIRARAAAFPRAVLNFNRAQLEIKSLKEELAKFRQSDPGDEGGEGKGGSGAGAGDEGELSGIEAASRAMKF